MPSLKTNHKSLLTNISHFSKLNITVFVLIFACVGTYYLFFSHAANLIIPYTSTAPTIDGNLNEPQWNITTPVAKTVVGSTTDTASWGALWDNNYLYVGVKVQDSNLYNSNPNIWDNSAVEVFVDPNADGGTTYDSKDAQIIQGWNNPTLGGFEATLPGVEHAWTTIPGGYSIEMAIPWSSLGTTPIAKNLINMDIAVDSSGGSSGRAGQLVWNGTATDSTNPSSFGTLNLGSPSSVSITSPVNNAVVSGTTTLSSSAVDNSGSGMNNVQFKLDSTNLGSSVTTTPYNYSWDTTTESNGFHSISALATDNDSDSTTSSSITVLVCNEPTLYGDVDCDGSVTGHDLSLLLANYGANYSPAEFDGGNSVEGHDLSILLTDYGKSVSVGNLTPAVNATCTTNCTSANITWSNDPNATSFKGAIYTTATGGTPTYDDPIASPWTLTPSQGQTLYYSVASEGPAGERWSSRVGIAWSAASAATVSSTPEGPPAPSGGWSVEYADGFGEPLYQGTGSTAGYDNTLSPTAWNISSYPCTGPSPPPGTDEIDAFSCGQDVVNPATGLSLNCNYSLDFSSLKGDERDYDCGAAGSFGDPTGYDMFHYNPNSTGNLVFQIVAQVQPNSGEADPAWWSYSDTGGSGEIDFYEMFGWQAGAGGTWCNYVGGTGSSGNGVIDSTDPTAVGSVSGYSDICHDLGFDQSAGLHTYTTELGSDRSMREWIDGKPVAWSYVSPGGSDYTSGGTVIGPYSVPSDWYHIIFQNSMRDEAVCPNNPAACDPDPYFTSGTRTYLVRSVAVYENTSAANAGTEINTTPSTSSTPPLIAPGTTISP